MQEPIIAYHIVFGAYGFWLPNDPRGSWSTQVWAPNLIRFGSPIPANTRQSLAKNPHDRQLRLAAKAALQRPAVRFNEAQIQCIAKAIGDDVRKYELPCYAAAIMPDHVHMVIARKAQLAEQWVGYFKRAASRELRKAGLHPFGEEVDSNDRVPTPWCEGGWKVYLHNAIEIGRCVRYTEKNPEEAGLPAQRWDFVTPFVA